MKWLVLILTFASLKAFSQTAEEAVKKPIKLLFDGMRNSDSNMLKAAFTTGAILQTVVKDKDGATKVQTESAVDFIAALSKPHASICDERIRFDVIRVDSDMAIVWTPYKFYLGDQFSHCGVNSFQLVKLNNEWKIQYLIDTRRKDNCP